MLKGQGGNLQGLKRQAVQRFIFNIHFYVGITTFVRWKKPINSYSDWGGKNSHHMDFIFIPVSPNLTLFVSTSHLEISNPACNSIIKHLGHGKGAT